MRAADFIPENERERMAAVKRYDVLDTPPDGAFDREEGEFRYDRDGGGVEVT